MKSIVQAVPALGATPDMSDRGWPVFRLGFRPFYLLAACFACLAVPVWALVYAGQLAWAPNLPPMLWHAHEMVFGFATAVIIGFLLTAGKAWTGLPTPRGLPLALLALTWLAARVAALLDVPYAVYAVLDLALLPIVAVILVLLLLRADNHRNLLLAGLLGLLALANLVFHLSVSGLLELSALRPLYAGLALIVLVECVMAGRVVPAFTMNAIAGLRIKSRPLLDRAVLAASALALALWVFMPAAMVTAPMLAVAAILQAARVMSWKPLQTRGKPILWILHLAYAWIPMGFVLLAMAQFGWVAPSAGIHAFAVGATGGLIIGMLTRTARGHTGRPLLASPFEVAAYTLVMLAAALRVFMPMVAPQWQLWTALAAATAWSLAFVLYLVTFTPWLLRARLDGKDG